MVDGGLVVWKNKLFAISVNRTTVYPTTVNRTTVS